MKTCQKCNTNLVQVGEFWICPIHGQQNEPAKKERLRVFLSYGHDRNEEVVLKIKIDLEKRGHDVWIDKNEIKFGDNWRRSITDGIIKSDKVLSFLSKHSTREPGICLDEIAIAVGIKGGNILTILLENENEVKPPISISHIQWLDMHEWDTNINDKSWYDKKFKEIINVIESPYNIRFSGEISKLKDDLKPISSEVRINNLLKKEFVGRRWLIEKVENWLNNRNNNSQIFWIAGKPGAGKSAFAAQLVHYGNNRVIASQFIEWDKPDHKNPQRIIRSIAFQLATCLPEYRKLLLTLPEINNLDKKNATELFDYLLITPLSYVLDTERQPQIIIIDALDEASDGENNELVDILSKYSNQLPKWICFLVTSRPDATVVNSLQNTIPYHIEENENLNTLDIKEYLLSKKEYFSKVGINIDESIDALIKRSEGTFLYIELLCNDLLNETLSIECLDNLPQGLSGTYYHYFQRHFSDTAYYNKNILPALRLITSAFEALPINILKVILGYSYEEIGQLFRELGSLFQVVSKDDILSIQPCHKSVTDWLNEGSKSGKFFVSSIEGHKLMANQFNSIISSDNNEIELLEETKYWGHWGFKHLAFSSTIMVDAVSVRMLKKIVDNATDYGVAMGEFSSDRVIPFLLDYLSVLLRSKNESAIIRLLSNVKLFAFIEYIDAGILGEIEQERAVFIDGKYYRYKDCDATNASHCYQGIKYSVYAGSILKWLIESNGAFSKNFSRLVKDEIEILAYYANGFEVIGWADCFSPFFSDFGNITGNNLYKLINIWTEKQNQENT